MLDPVPNHNRYRITPPNPTRKQAMSELVHPGIELTVGNAAKLIDCRDLNRQLVSVAAQTVAH
jgi:hypothetical protein